ncbi:MAG: hypothetical protein OXN89_08710, partial [Bryobacterales bacterium]|nr:hypothetical protein [Bryobacterales bacterium]
TVAQTSPDPFNIESPWPRPRCERSILRQAASVLEPALDPAFGMPALAVRLERSQSVFQELRDLLRLPHDALRGRQAPSPACPRTAAALLESMPARLQAHRDALRQRIKALPDRPGDATPVPEAIVLQYLKRYQDGLCGHPVARDEAGRIVAVVERTNNPPEQFFSQAKRRLRRRVGRANLGRDMQDQPAQVALAANLLDEHYVRIMCGTLDGLPAAFAEVDRSAASTVKPTLDRMKRNSHLRQRIRQWESESAIPTTAAPESTIHAPSRNASGTPSPTES